MARYNKQTWQDGVSPVNAERMNHMEDGIAGAVRTINGATPDANGNVEVSGNGSGGTVDVDATLTQSGMAADAKAVGDAIGQLSEAIDDFAHRNEVEVTTETPIDFSTSEVGYVHKNGIMIEGETLGGVTFFNHTQPFVLKQGERIDISAKGYNQGATVLAILAKVETTGYTPLLETTDGTNVAEYTYTAERDCSVVISYDNRFSYSATIFSTKIVNTAEKGAGHAHYVKRQDDTVYIKSRYNDEEDIVIQIALAGGNHLPNPNKIYTVIKSGNTMDNNTVPSRYLLDRYTDWFSPHQVRAVNNPNGDNTSTVIFTGGNHMSNNSSSGGVVTGVCTQFDVFCDGVFVENGNEAYCNGLTMPSRMLTLA